MQECSDDEFKIVKNSYFSLFSLLGSIICAFLFCACFSLIIIINALFSKGYLDHVQAVSMSIFPPVLFFGIIIILLINRYFELQNNYKKFCKLMNITHEELTKLRSNTIDMNNSGLGNHLSSLKNGIQIFERGITYKNKKYFLAEILQIVDVKQPYYLELENKKKTYKYYKKMCSGIFIISDIPCYKFFMLSQKL